MVNRAHQAERERQTNEDTAIPATPETCAYGAGTRNRTADLLITNQSLYRLSYSGIGWGGCDAPAPSLGRAGALVYSTVRESNNAGA